MKKILFGTTALIAAGAFAASASADPISLSIGGKQEMFFGAGDVNDEAGETWAGTGMATDTELYFSGETTLDNGITVRAVIQLEAEDSADRNADEQYIRLSGGFGALQIGQKEGYVGQMQYTAPEAGGVIGWDETWDWLEFAGGHVENYYTDDDLSVSYVTPAFFGFSLAATYAPDSSDNDDSAFEDWNNTTSDYKDLFAVGAAFDNEFSGVGIHADFTYQYQFGAGQTTTTTVTVPAFTPTTGTEIAAQTLNVATATTSAGTPDRSLIRGGAAVSYMGFELGGSYGVWMVDGNDNDMENWNVGVGYTNGPYGVAFVYTDSHTDNGANDVDSHSFQFSGNYVLGPGIDLGAAVFHGNEDTPAGTADRETTGVLFGIGLSF
jgi:outer membrane protein OmpU